VRIGKPIDTGGVYSSASLDAEGKLVMTSAYGAPSFARVWRAANGQAVSPSLVHRDFPIKGRLLDGGHTLFTVSSDGSGREWDLSQPTNVPRAEFTHEGTLFTAAISRDARWVATGASDGTVHLWDRRASIRLPLTVSAGAQADAGGLSFNGAFAVAAAEKHVWIRETHTGVVKRLGRCDVEHAAVSNDGSQIAITTHTGKTMVLDAITGKPIAEPESRRTHQPDEMGDMPSLGLTFSPDDRFLVDIYSSHADIVGARDGRFSGTQLSHEDIIRSARFSADAKRLVTSSRDGTARIWTSLTGEPIGLPLHIGRQLLRPGSQAIWTRWSRHRAALIWSCSLRRQALSRVPCGERLHRKRLVQRRRNTCSDHRLLNHRARLGRRRPPLRRHWVLACRS
jgi:WD40 repeat protein